MAEVSNVCTAREGDAFTVIDKVVLGPDQGTAGIIRWFVRTTGVNLELHVVRTIWNVLPGGCDNLALKGELGFYASRGRSSTWRKETR